MGDTRLEQIADSSEKTNGGSEVVALVHVNPADSGPIDAELAEVVVAWPGLSEAVRSEILALVRR